MEQLKYAPLIGQKLTRELLDTIIRDLKAEIKAEIRLSKRARGKKVAARPQHKVHLEDDGA